MLLEVTGMGYIQLEVIGLDYMRLEVTVLGFIRLSVIVLDYMRLEVTGLDCIYNAARNIGAL